MKQPKNTGSVGAWGKYFLYNLSLIITSGLILMENRSDAASTSSMKSNDLDIKNDIRRLNNKTHYQLTIKSDKPEIGAFKAHIDNSIKFQNALFNICDTKPHIYPHGLCQNEILNSINIATLMLELKVKFFGKNKLKIVTEHPKNIIDFAESFNKICATASSILSYHDKELLENQESYNILYRSLLELRNKTNNDDKKIIERAFDAFHKIEEQNKFVQEGFKNYFSIDTAIQDIAGACKNFQQIFTEIINLNIEKLAKDYSTFFYKDDKIISATIHTNHTNEEFRTSVKQISQDLNKISTGHPDYNQAQQFRDILERDLEGLTLQQINSPKPKFLNAIEIGPINYLIFLEFSNALKNSAKILSNEIENNWVEKALEEITNHLCKDAQKNQYIYPDDSGILELCEAMHLIGNID